MKRSILPAILAGVSVLALASCERREPAAPILQEPTASAIRGVSASALEKVVSAIEAVDAGMSAAETLEKLRAAEAALRKMTEYYVPLLDAHEHAYRAYRLYYADPSRVEIELDRIETILHDVVRDRGSEVEGQIDEVLGLIEEIRISMEADSPATAGHLDDLARRLSFMLLKAELILRE